MKEKLNKINNKYVRLVVMVVVAINSRAMMMGYELLPFTNDQIVTGLSFVAMVAVEVWNHYMNNNYTTEAKQAQNYLDSIKDAE